MLTYLQSIIMSMFPRFKLADFLSERDLKGIIIDASTYSNIQLNIHTVMSNLTKSKGFFTIYHTIWNINDPGKEGFWKHCRKWRK